MLDAPLIAHAQQLDGYQGRHSHHGHHAEGVAQDVAAEGTIEKINDAIKALEAGTLHVFDTANFTVDGKTLTEYLADVDGDYTGETNVIHDGYFDESNAVDFRSAPYFDIIIDGVTNLNTNFGG